MAQMYREAIQCERLRADVFAGRKSPLIFGQPDEWLALLIEALLVTGTPRASSCRHAASTSGQWNTTDGFSAAQSGRDG